MASSVIFSISLMVPAAATIAAILEGIASCRALNRASRLSVAQLRVMAEWLAAFVEAWGQVEESNHGGEEARPRA
jgi:hypothetical protein